MNDIDNIENVNPNSPKKLSKRVKGELITPSQEDVEKFGSYHKAYYALNKNNYEFKVRTHKKVGRPNTKPSYYLLEKENLELKNELSNIKLKLTGLLLHIRSLPDLPQLPPISNGLPPVELS